MENNPDEKCKGCKYLYEIDFYGGDMPSTFICKNEKFCFKLSGYDRKIKLKPRTIPFE